MASAVGFSIPDRQLSQRLSPAGIWIPSMLDRLTIFLEEQMIVIDLSGAFHLVAQCELAIQDLQRRGHRVIRRSSPVFVEFLSMPATRAFVDAEGTRMGVQVRDGKRDLFGGRIPGEKI